MPGQENTAGHPSLAVSPDSFELIPNCLFLKNPGILRFIPNKDSAQRLMHCVAVGGKRESGFDQSCPLIRLSHRECKAVPTSPPGT